MVKVFLWSACLDEKVEDLVLNLNTKSEKSEEEKKDIIIEEKKRFKERLGKKSWPLRF